MGSVIGSCSINTLLEEVSKRNWVIFNEVINLGVEFVEDIGVSGDEGGLMAVASCEILRGDDTNLFSWLRLHEKDFGMVVGKIGALHRLCDERP